MSFFSCFRLRAAQQVLCVSYSVPVALFLTTAFSSFGTWSVSLFWACLTALMVLTWGGLALYTRETDRVRKLAASREATIRKDKCVVVVRMQAHEKAQLMWEVLQDDDVVRRQLKAWGRCILRYLTLSFRYLPSVVLMAACLVFWLESEEGVKVVESIRKCPPDSIVRWAAGGLTSMYLITGLGWITCDVVLNRLPVNCFREALLAKVAEHQQRDERTSHSGVRNPAEPFEIRESEK